MPNASQKVAADRKSAAIRKAEADNAAEAKKHAAKETAPAVNPVAKKASSITGMTNDELRAYLLATPTIPDARWASDRNVPDRNAKESRADYINRVLRP